MTQRVLIVDDEPVNRLVLFHILKAQGYEIAQAANGAEALHVLKTETIHWLFLDLNMPVLDGYQTIAALSSPPFSDLQQLKIVIVSATDRRTFEEELIRLQLTDTRIIGFLQKPISLPHLHQLMSGTPTRSLH